MTAFALSQILVGIGFVFGASSYQFKSRRAMLLLMACSASFSATHFFLLERPGPACMMLIVSARYVTAIFIQNRKCMYLFLLVSTVVFLITFTNTISLLSLLAAVLGTIGSFQSKNRLVRLWLIACTSTWLTHNILAGSPVAVIMEATFLVSGIIGYRRHCRTVK